MDDAKVFQKIVRVHAGCGGEFVNGDIFLTNIHTQCVMGKCAKCGVNLGYEVGLTDLWKACPKGPASAPVAAADPKLLGAPPAEPDMTTEDAVFMEEVGIRFPADDEP